MSELLQLVVKAADQRLAEAISVLDFRGHSPFTDYFVIASAKNERMADSIVDHVIEEAEKAGFAVRNVEGGQSICMRLSCTSLSAKNGRCIIWKSCGAICRELRSSYEL